MNDSSGNAEFVWNARGICDSIRFDLVGKLRAFGFLGALRRIESSQGESSQGESSQAESSQVRPSRARPNQARLSQAKTSQLTQVRPSSVNSHISENGHIHSSQSMPQVETEQQSQ